LAWFWQWHQSRSWEEKIRRESKKIRQLRQILSTHYPLFFPSSSSSSSSSNSPWGSLEEVIRKLQIGRWLVRIQPKAPSGKEKKRYSALVYLDLSGIPFKKLVDFLISLRARSWVEHTLSMASQKAQDRWKVQLTLGYLKRLSPSRRV
ncbi:MAG: hypothetical protein D6805_04630, partial [Planctomycetota bacterium]